MPCRDREIFVATGHSVRDRRMLSQQRLSITTEEFCRDKDYLSRQTGPVGRIFFFDLWELGRHIFTGKQIEQ